MTPAAPRIDPRLVERVSHLDSRGRSIAEIHRLVGDEAWNLGLPRPSYEQTRAHVHAAREEAAALDELTVRLRFDRYRGIEAISQAPGPR